MLIVDVDTLQTIGALHLADQVILYSLSAHDLKDIVRIDRAVGDLVTLLDTLTVLHGYTVAEGDQISAFLRGLGVVDHSVAAVLDLFEADLAVDLGDDREVLGLTYLKELLNSGQTLCDIFRGGDAAGMEGTHRQLSTGLTDRLSGDDTYRLTDGDGLTVRQVRAVALLADAVLGAAAEDGTDLDALYTGVDDDIGLFLTHEDILADQHVAVLITEVMDEVTAEQTLVHLFDDLLAGLDIKDLEALGGMTVILADDDLLRSAVSARPLRAPREEMKYSKMFRPSR